MHHAARFLYPFADAIIAVSQGVADELSALNPRLQSKIHVLPTPVISSRLLARDEIPHPWFCSHDIPVVLGVGRLQRQKDFSALIDAFALVREKVRCRLVILGEGPLRTELEAKVEGLRLTRVVDLPGFVENPFPYFRRARVFVLSSRYEGMPNVLLQAMACGTPVVATDCPSGPRECLENGRYGALVPVGDIEALAGAISRALHAPRRPDAAAAILEKHDAVRAAKRYLDVAGLSADGSAPPIPAAAVTDAGVTAL